MLDLRLVIILLLAGAESIPAAAQAFDASASGSPATVQVGALAAPSLRKSIGNWVSCSGTSDDTEGVARAFAAARHAAFTLVVDCPVMVHSGLDIGRVVYIDDGTNVIFTGAGKFTVDNVMHPAFVMANSSGITLTDWNVQYDASLPADPDVGGFANNGKFVNVVGHTQPTSAWNDIAMTSWLAANRAVVFDRSEGIVRSRWVGATNACAIFFMSGDTSKVTISGLNVSVPSAAGADRFVPVVFQLSPNFRSNQKVTGKLPLTAQFYAVPHDLIFSDITLDGTYMGWVGGAQNVVFERIRSHRYADLQDARGENVGGVGKWFAPPHLFYLVYDNTEDPALFNRNIRIHDVVDDGPRIGSARDKNGTERLSGYALSIKIGCSDCSVDTYTTSRPDGFLDVLSADGLTISNVDATYDSAFLNNLFPGWRFPSSPYSNLTFENISLKDSAPSTVYPPIGDSPLAANKNLVFRNVQVKLNGWSGARPLLPNIVGQGNEVALDYFVEADASRIVSIQKGSVSLSLQGTPVRLSPGGSVTLTWKSKDARACAAGGAWTGTVPTAGSRTVQMIHPGSYHFSLKCEYANDSSAIDLPVVVAP
jgi:hypothetical protein